MMYLPQRIGRFAPLLPGRRLQPQQQALLVRVVRCKDVGQGGRDQHDRQDRPAGPDDRRDPLDEDAQSLLDLAERVGGQGTICQINRDA